MTKCHKILIFAKEAETIYILSAFVYHIIRISIFNGNEYNR